MSVNKFISYYTLSKLCPYQCKDKHVYKIKEMTQVLDRRCPHCDVTYHMTTVRSVERSGNIEIHLQRTTRDPGCTFTYQTSPLTVKLVFSGQLGINEFLGMNNKSGELFRCKKREEKHSVSDQREE